LSSNLNVTPAHALAGALDHKAAVAVDRVSLQRNKPFATLAEHVGLAVLISAVALVPAGDAEGVQGHAPVVLIVVELRPMTDHRVELFAGLLENGQKLFAALLRGHVSSGP